jgi:moderate conductance mechanosensitive channel
MLLEVINNIIIPWITNHGPKILAIIVFALLLKRFGKIFIEKIIRRVVYSDSITEKESEKKREDTLIRIFSSFLDVLIWILTVSMILQEIGIAVGPLLAAAGIAGIAFGFGGQYLIRDLITGTFIIMENQYRIGDVVCFDGTCGSVEDISMRMTTLRDLDGVVHHVPHGEIKKVSNLSKYFARINLDIGVSYNSNLEKVIKVINKVGEALAKDPEWRDDILKTPQFLRVNDFAESAIIVKIIGETKSLKQWAVTGELRKRLKMAFDKEKIEIPFPQRVVHQVKK